MDDILFPHENIRKVQDEFIRDVVNVLKSKEHFLAHAPTGLGKTTILAPALAFALNNKKTVFFLTPKHTQHKIAVETLRKIKEKYKTDFTVIDLIGKKWMCSMDGIENLTSSEFLEYCKEIVEKERCDYSLNVKKNDKLEIEAELLIKELKEKNPLDVEKVKELCTKKGLCPYEISCIMARDADVIIGDYFHILHPRIREHLFKRMEKDLSECIIIFDEAHNLPDRIRDLMSTTISDSTLDIIYKEIKSIGYEEIAEDSRKIKEVLEKLVKKKMNIDDTEVLITKEELNKEIEKISNYEELCGNFRFVTDEVLEEKKKSFSSSLANFMESWVGPDEGFARILRKGFNNRGEAFISVDYKCLDPSILIKPISEKAQIIGMSGTLTPINMYTDLFGFNAVLREYEDPFPKENRLNLIVPKTTTKFSKRDPEMYQKIAIMTSKMANAIPGNSVVFFPSYKLKDDVYVFLKDLCEKTIFVEHQGMNKLEKEDLLENFKKYKDSGAVLIAISSGSFGEGIDLKGDYLKGVLVVGLPLGKPDLETNELIKYYDKRFKKGWEYAYIYPAMIKIIQNAGRCIRSSTDKGTIIFMDERYGQENYYKCFPKDWQIKITRLPIERIEKFFGT